MKILSREFLSKIIELGHAYCIGVSYTNYEYKLKEKVHPYTPISKDLKNKVKKLWGGGKAIKWCAFYNKFRPTGSDFNPYYLSDNIYYAIIDKFYNDYLKCLAVDDKNFYDFFYHDQNRPNTILRKSGNVLMNKDYRIITENDILEIVKNIETGLIIKKAENSMGGRNIHIWMPNESIESLINVLKEYKDCVVQQLVKQHESLSYLHKDSVNTIRIVTWNRMNEIIVLSSIVRMGVNGKKVDNASSGGIFCGINEDGTLKDVAYDTTGKMYEKHPQGAIFKGHKITNFDKCVTLVKSLAPRFSSISRLTSWDLAIDQNGEPLIIEANLSCGELDFHQITNGPLFGDYTEEMIKEVFAVKKYRRIRKILSLL